MSPYRVSGKDRRVLKKELSLIRATLKNHWRMFYLNSDLEMVYGGVQESRETAEKREADLKVQEADIARKLSELSSNP